MMRYCTFAGHREIFENGIQKRITEAVRELIESEMSICFFTGGMGEFDQICARVVRGLKKEYPHKEIQLVLVEPYMKQRINTCGTILHKAYDEIYVPIELAGCHYKQAITLRNRWMIEHSQYMIAYVFRKTGGAYSSMKYAEKKGLVVRNLYDGEKKE